MTTLIRISTIALIIFLIWFFNHSFDSSQVKNIGITEILGTDKEPDYYSENMQLREFNSQGQLLSLIVTERFSHYVDLQHALLESPKVVIYGIAGNTWEVTSKTGKIVDENRNLTLFNNVELSVSDADLQQKIMITTTELNYNVANHTLWTNAEVIADSNLGNFTALGLEMDLKTEQLFLKEKVRIHYDL